MIFIVFLYFGFEIFILKIYTNAILGKLLFFLKLLAFGWILRKALLIVAYKTRTRRVGKMVTRTRMEHGRERVLLDSLGRGGKGIAGELSPKDRLRPQALHIG